VDVKDEHVFLANFNNFVFIYNSYYIGVIATLYTSKILYIKYNFFGFEMYNGKKGVTE